MSWSERERQKCELFVPDVPPGHQGRRWRTPRKEGGDGS
jgi:hypothetical protein